VFVLDVENVLKRLDRFQQRLIAMSVLEEYSQAEVARLLPCSLRRVERELPEALDSVSRMFLEGGLIREFAGNTRDGRACQEGRNRKMNVSSYNNGRNIS
jgi:predicted DNA-binding protein (UPF0251 family)